MRNQLHSKYGKLMNSDRKPMGSRQKNFYIGMNERTRNMNGVTTDVGVSIEVSTLSIQGAA